MQQVMENLIKVNSDVPEGAYYNEVEQLWYCEKCNTSKQCHIVWMGQPHTVNCLCDCEKKSNAEIRNQQIEANRIVKIRANRNVGIPGKLYDKTFGSFEVNTENRKNFELCKKYAEKFAQMKADNIGLRLCGSNGTGKTHLAAAIGNALIDREYRVYMRTMDELVAEIFNSFDKNAVVNDICSFDLLIIDEFGQERATETVQQYVQDIINTRVINKKPFIITTNVVRPDENSMDLCDRRIYSRFNETLMTLAFSGADMREVIHKEKVDRFKEIINS